MILLIANLTILALLIFISGVYLISRGNKRKQASIVVTVEANDFITKISEIESKQAAEANRNFEWEG